MVTGLDGKTYRPKPSWSERGVSAKLPTVAEELKQRRFEPVVRLELQPNADPAMVAELRSRFSLAPDDIYEMSALLDYTTLFEIAGRCGGR